ncbi:BfmA/BtgA family mobilization protein [Christiangramia echinicola]|uniref:Uncharacterized protein n=1 Tax=Christiangramia echinicola TaxID=279359 RepID=A0A1H1LD49_9FLAO|nr:BfmA/BtgA family mobilization protein [Christiangramia echinicola]SDR72521.1 hypothetical protein SAMN04488552_0723 [Christiangramia echinicola]
MDKGYEKEHFATFKIKSTVAEKFRKYSRGIGESHSMTLLLMLEFFEYNQIAPYESLGPRMQTLESAIKKRINALVAIVRDIEKNQTLPTKGMLDALFEGLPAQTKKKIIPSFEEAFRNSEINAKDRPKIQTEPDHKDIRFMLNRIELVKPRFGHSHWKLAMDTDEIKRLKTKYHVYHD